RGGRLRRSGVTTSLQHEVVEGTAVHVHEGFNRLRAERGLGRTLPHATALRRAGHVVVTHALCVRRYQFAVYANFTVLVNHAVNRVFKVGGRNATLLVDLLNVCSRVMTLGRSTLVAIIVGV